MDASFVYTNLVEVLTSAVDSLLNGFVFDGYEALSNALAMPMVGLFTLYVILMGFSMAFGWSNFSAAEFASVILKFSVISTVVLNWSFVSEYFFNLLNSSIDEISSALISHEKMHLPFVGDLDSGIQQALTQFTKLGSLVFDTGGLSNLGGFFDGMVIWLVGYIFTGIALFEIILSKVMLALLFVFTPLMALFCLFDPFKPLCGRWLGLILGFALL